MPKPKTSTYKDGQTIYVVRGVYNHSLDHDEQTYEAMTFIDQPTHGEKFVSVVRDAKSGSLFSRVVSGGKTFLRYRLANDPSDISVLIETQSVICTTERAAKREVALRLIAYRMQTLGLRSTVAAISRNHCS